jgi:methylated-DNA-[protein]-cysteine S-methyltransferase
MHYTNFESPLGPLLMAANDRGLCLIHFAGGKRPMSAQPDWKKDEGIFAEAIFQLREYFRGNLRQFDLPLALEGTPFQISVWERLREIPFGETISYGELARRIGQPNAARAVGLANGSNPIPIIVPCHRVIGSNGKLVGYGGGLEIKEKLLALESQQMRLL